MKIHQYINRMNNEVIDEKLFADRIITFLYSKERENNDFFKKIFSGKMMNDFLGFMNFDMPLASSLINNKSFLRKNGVDLNESLEPESFYNTPRKIFERKIRYWECRPMSRNEDEIVSPADSKMIAGTLKNNSLFGVKGKFFNFDELLGKKKYIDLFQDGDIAIFRLTPDKYHYNHLPVSGIVEDIYDIDGCFNSCNPGAIVNIENAFSKNRRVVTIIDTDVDNGTKIGKVAMIEVVALMIGEIVQCYSENKYENPLGIIPGMFVKKGQPKSCYRPGSSTDILVFQKNKISFSSDILENMKNKDINSRYTIGFNNSCVETEIDVRSVIAKRR